MAFKNKPLKTKQYTQAQSAYENVPSLSTRAIMLAPSGSGKTVLLVNMLTDVYKDCFEAGIHVFSHSIHIDDAWQPVKRHMKERGFEPEAYTHDKYDEEKLAQILAQILDRDY